MYIFIAFNHLFWAATPRNRAQSAPPSRSGRTGHDLWMTAVKNRETGQWCKLSDIYVYTCTKYIYEVNFSCLWRFLIDLYISFTASLTHRHPESPRHKSTTEYWVDTLRRTGTGKPYNPHPSQFKKKITVLHVVQPIYLLYIL